MRQRYRKPNTPYLESKVGFKVRFQEVDSLGIVWHGHYLSYFEQAREAFGIKYGLSYLNIRDSGLAAPVVHASCDYHQPAIYGDELEVTARLHFVRAARLEMSFEVRRDLVLLATGFTVQVFTDFEGRLILNRPPILEDFYRRWDGEHDRT